MKTVVISQPMYFPWVGLLEQMRCADVWVHLDDAQFSKGGFMNRVQVKTDQGLRWLTVPLQEHSLETTLNQIRPAAHDWPRKHLATLTQSMAGAPFQSEMMALAEGALQDAGSLAQLGARSMEGLANYFDVLPGDIRFASAMGVDGTGWERVLEICRITGAERYVTGHGARNYLDHEAFEAAGVRVEYLDYEQRAYPQLHGEFIPYVTGLDLAANCGRAGREVIASGSIYWKDFLHRSAD